MSKDIEQILRRVVQEELGKRSPPRPDVEELGSLTKVAAVNDIAAGKISKLIKAGKVRRYGKGRSLKVSFREVRDALRAEGAEKESRDADEAARHLLQGSP